MLHGASVADFVTRSLPKILPHPGNCILGIKNVGCAKNSENDYGGHSGNFQGILVTGYRFTKSLRL